MDEMRQVSRTVATVALLLLILPHALRSEDDSSVEGQQVDRSIENSMHQMAFKLEKNLGVSLAETHDMSKAFGKLTEYVKKKALKNKAPGGGNSFGIYFEVSRKKKKGHDLIRKRNYQDVIDDLIE